MAYNANDPNNQEQDSLSSQGFNTASQSNSGQAPGTNAPMQPASSNEAATTSTAPASAQAPIPGRASPQGSGRFTNIQKYLNANKPADGEQSLAGKLGGKVEGTAAQIGQNVTGAQQKLQQDIGTQQGSLAQGQNYLNLFNAPGANPTPGPTPEEIANDPTKLADFQKYSSGTSGLGNLAVQDQNKLETDTAKLGDIAKATGTETGRFGLLSNYFGRPGYTQGQKKLDQLILQQGNKTGLNDLQQNTTAAAKQHQAALDATKGQAAEQNKALQQGAGTLATNLKTALGSESDATGTAPATGAYSYLNDLRTKAAQETTEAKLGQTALNDVLTGKRTGDSLSPEEQTAMNKIIQSSGIDPNQQWLSLGSDSAAQNGIGSTGTFLNQATAAGLGDVAQSSDVARYNALNALAGQPGGQTLTDATIAAHRDPYALINAEGAKTTQGALAAQQAGTHNAVKDFAGTDDPAKLNQFADAIDQMVAAQKHANLYTGGNAAPFMNEVNSYLNDNPQLRDAFNRASGLNDYSGVEGWAKYAKDVRGKINDINKYGSGRSLAEILKGVKLENMPNPGSSFKELYDAAQAKRLAEPPTLGINPLVG